jgi:hypothetical protein|tara:strand:- start:48 stop:428 length:381 start_codon:yes stop_codon:yes gene_type:complete
MSTVKAANLQNTGSGAPAFKNSSGTEIGQLAKAWVNFNGTGTVAIRDSFNVSSIADNGTGEYQVNFTNAMEDVNYAVAGFARVSLAAGQFVGVSDTGFATSSVKVGSMNNSDSFADALYVTAVIFR